MSEAMTVDSVRYNRTARTLHWILALLVITNLATGLLHEPLEHSIKLMPFHKAVGITILGLTLVRILWRLGWHAAAFPTEMSGLERWAARAVHFAFYFLLIAMPLTGWIVASTGKTPISWFGLFAWPKLAVAKGTTIAAVGHEGHELMGWLFLALVVLHIAAALRHHFLLRDDVLRRMV
jgi:cytochrome b561